MGMRDAFESVQTKANNNIFKTKTFIIDLIILSIVPLPFYERYVCLNMPNTDPTSDLGKIVTVKHFMSDYFLLLMFFRLIFLFKTMFNYSLYNDAYFKQLCRQYGFNPNTRFSFKCYLQLRPERTVITLFTTTTCILAYMFRIFELPVLDYNYGADKSEFTIYMTHMFNSIYTTIITMTTVGFGDFTPKTFVGKLVLTIAALWGAFMISIMVLSVSSIFELKKTQLRALRHIRLANSASRTISSTFKFFMEKRRFYKLKVMIDP